MKYQFTYPNIPYDIIKEILGPIRVKEKPINLQLLDHYLKDVPLRNPLELVNCPFIKQKGGIMAVHHLMTENWTSWIRINLMKGGKSANIVGKAWEGYIAHVFKENGWSVIQGLKLKKQGKIFTDIDILAKREDLLLIIQMKVYYGTGVDTFEQWKFRKKLEHGIEQVKKSQDAIRSNIKILKSHFTQSKLNEINRSKSLVVTNAHYYNGWSNQNIPIVSTGSLMQIFNGATATFSSDEEVYEEKNYGGSNLLSVDEILGFIKKPLDWRIGNQNYKIKLHTEEFKDAVMKFPILVNSFK